jgi:pimeloyl-ACP methyl ester carboxylesterase
VSAAGEWEELTALPAPPPDRVWHYGAHPSQVVDHYGPDAGPRVTLLHGGYWRERFDRAYLRATADALAGHGFAVALAEYRRVGGGGEWPRMAEDVAAVVAGAWPDDGRRQVLAGHSAGGQLALWAAHRLPERVSGVLALGALADLATARRLGLSDGAVDALLGGEPLESADPMALLPAARPAVLLHGTEDPDVPPELSRRYAAASGAVLRELPGAGHFAPLVPGTAGFGELLRALRELA